MTTLKNELREAQNEYTRLLAELQLLEKLEVRNKVVMSYHADAGEPY